MRKVEDVVKREPLALLTFFFCSKSNSRPDLEIDIKWDKKQIIKMGKKHAKSSFIQRKLNKKKTNSIDQSERQSNQRTRKFPKRIIR